MLDFVGITFTECHGSIRADNHGINKAMDKREFCLSFIHGFCVA